MTGCTESQSSLATVRGNIGAMARELCCPDGRHSRIVFRIALAALALMAGRKLTKYVVVQRLDVAIADVAAGLMAYRNHMLAGSWTFLPVAAKAKLAIPQSDESRVVPLAAERQTRFCRAAARAGSQNTDTIIGTARRRSTYGPRASPETGLRQDPPRAQPACLHKSAAD
jgi:hypothetical protein